MTSIFISSTRGYIDSYRHAAIEVCHRLGLLPVAMEEMRPEGTHSLEACRRLIRDADALVGIIGHALGSTPQGQDLCFTELEIRYAAELGIPIHIFIVDPDQPWKPSEIDPDQQPALDEMKKRLNDEHTTRAFTTVETFREDVLLTLQDHVNRTPKQPCPQVRTSPPNLDAHPHYVMRQKFTGRSTDLAAIVDWANSEDPIMVIEGIGGLGKSALTWTWTQHEATTAIPALAGRLWWSFYEGSAQIDRFIAEALHYIIGDAAETIPHTQHFTRLTDELRTQPYLLVLDGFERMLNAYHQLDPSKLRDDDVDPNSRGLIDERAARLLLSLTQCSPSKILISTRLMPSDLQGPSGTPLPGVQHYRLPDLSPEDTSLLVHRLGITADPRTIGAFFGALGNHPLVIGVVCGIVRDYRKAPSDFEKWLADPHAGGTFHFADLPLTQKHAHVLHVALDLLSPDQEQLLGWLSVFSAAVTYDTLIAINPFQPLPPTPPKTTTFLDEWLAKRQTEKQGTQHEPQDQPPTDDQQGYDRELATWHQTRNVKGAPARLDRALTDLEDRGLLWWERQFNTYDLHPVVRAYAHDRLTHDQRIAANRRVRDHFTGLPPEDAYQATSVEDLTRSITIFRATLGAGETHQALLAFEASNLDRLNHLAAYPTVVELLGDVIDTNSEYPDLLFVLGEARRNIGNHDGALELLSRSLEIRLLEALKAETIDPDLITIVAVMAACERQKNRLAHAKHYLTRVSPIIPKCSVHNELTYRTILSLILIDTGNIDEATKEVTNARQSGPDKEIAVILDFFEVQINHLRGIDITHQLDDLDHRSRTPVQRRNVLQLRAQHASALQDHETSATWLSELLRLQRGAGMSTDETLADLSREKTKTGDTTEAQKLIEHVNAPTVAHAWVASRLERSDAPALALAAYERAWGDGPPCAQAEDLKEATDLLEEMDIPLPSLTLTQHDSVTIPHEKELKEYISSVFRREAKRGDGAAPVDADTV